MEKRDAYLSINSLSVYILLESNVAEALLYRRSDDGFACETYRGLDALIPLSDSANHTELLKIFRELWDLSGQL